MMEPTLIWEAPLQDIAVVIFLFCLVVATFFWVIGKEG